MMRRADLREAQLNDAQLNRVNLTNAKLSGADLKGAKLRRAKFKGADLSDADLSGADLTASDLEVALSLKNTDLRQVIGLTKEQLTACKAKGAIIDEDFVVHSSQPTISSPPLVQSNDIQPQSSKPAQVSMPVF